MRCNESMNALSKSVEDKNIKANRKAAVEDD